MTDKPPGEPGDETRAPGPFFPPHPAPARVHLHGNARVRADVHGGAR